MKSLIKKLINSDIAMLLRNTLRIRISNHNFPVDYDTPVTTTDCFLWRTDSNYKTIFKYKDILKLFHNINDSWVEIHIFSKMNKLLKIEKIYNLDISNKFEINSKYLSGLEDFGLFYIYHYTKNKSILLRENIISNRCYVGYSQNNKIYSFLHGNIHARYTSIYNNNKISSNIVNRSVFKTSSYKIQKYFDISNKNEFFVCNPTYETIKFSTQGQNYKLKSGCAMCIAIKQPVILIVSNLFYLRPTIFSYKDEYLDVHHS